MKNEMDTVTQEQFILLQGLMVHCWAVYHEDADEDFEFWAEQLDEAKVPWHVQNTAAYLMNNRENGFRYFRSLLASQGIEVVNEKK